MTIYIKRKCGCFPKNKLLLLLIFYFLIYIIESSRWRFLVACFWFEEMWTTLLYVLYLSEVGFLGLRREEILNLMILRGLVLKESYFIELGLFLSFGFPSCFIHLFKVQRFTTFKPYDGFCLINIVLLSYLCNMLAEPTRLHFASDPPTSCIIIVELFFFLKLTTMYNWCICAVCWYFSCFLCHL